MGISTLYCDAIGIGEQGEKLRDKGYASAKDTAAITKGNALGHKERGMRNER